MFLPLIPPRVLLLQWFCGQRLSRLLFGQFPFVPRFQFLFPLRLLLVLQFGRLRLLLFVRRHPRPFFLPRLLRFGPPRLLCVLGRLFASIAILLPIPPRRLRPPLLPDSPQAYFGAWDLEFLFPNPAARPALVSPARERANAEHSRPRRVRC